MRSNPSSSTENEVIKLVRRDNIEHLVLVGVPNDLAPAGIQKFWTNLPCLNRLI
jgi:hypothetical protein